MRDFSFEFRVPEACTLQEIHLVSTGQHEITGDAWFDRLVIHERPPPVTGQATAAKGDK